MRAARAASCAAIAILWMCPAAWGDAPPATAGASAPGAASSAATPASAPAALEVTYFYSPTCVKCREAVKTVEAVALKYGPRIRLVKRSIDDPENVELLLAMEQQSGSSPSPPPKIFVNAQCLQGLEAIQQRLDSTVQAQLAAAVVALPEVTGGSAAASYTLGLMIVAGLIDGVNPCAFTTIVFLLSMLAYLKRTRMELAVVSAAFTLSVFLTYLALGLGIFYALKALSVATGVSRGITYAMAGLTFILGGWSFIDAIRVARSGKVEKATLGLPKRIKQAVHSVIRTGLKTRGLAVGALVVGFLVSILESFCTGQTYVPSIQAVVNSIKTPWRAGLYLVIYNVMFILPLVFVTALAYWGVGSQRIGKVLTEHLSLAKVLMGILFVGLGTLLLFTV
ncbi:MAG: hypothetical protein ACE15C_07430 [Phycisphaerae bacterium]